MTFVGGYTVFLSGFWDVPTFFFSYTMIGVFPILFFGWKVVKKTKWRRPEEVELRPRELLEVEEYERHYVKAVPRRVNCPVFPSGVLICGRNKFVGWFDRIFS